MGITEMIKRDEVRSLLDRLVPSYTRRLSIPRRVAATSTKVALTGIAFDYALRFELERRYTITKSHRWLPESEMARLKTAQLGDIAQSVERDMRDARRFFHQHIKGKEQPTRAWMTILAQHALKLARLDGIFRGGYLGHFMFERNHPKHVDEIVDLLGCVPFEAIAAPGADVVLKPKLRRHAAFVQGAEIDFIAAGRMIDIRVTAEPWVERCMVRRLIAHLILARSEQEDGGRRPPIESIGIYFARHGHLWALPASVIVDRPGYAEIEQQFLHCVEHERPPRTSAA